MYRRLPIDEKLIAIKRVLHGEKVSKICRDEGVSRTIFYKWLNTYKKTGARGKRKVLTARVVRGASHWKSFDQEIQKKIKNLALKNPLLSPQKIAKIVNASPAGVWYVLKRNGLNTKEARLQYIYRNGQSLVRAWPVSSKLTMMRRFEAGEKVSKICRDFGISRTIFYRWFKRYEQEKSNDSLESLRPRGEEHYRFIPEAPNLILELVIKNPEFTHKKISHAITILKDRQIISPSGVYSILRKLNLNTYQRRLNYARANAPVTPALKPPAISRIKEGFGEIPSISAIPPPASFFGNFFSAYSRILIPLSLVFALAILTFIAIASFSDIHGIAQAIGIVFSLLAFTFGIFFFLYSLKYYLTIGMVLTFSRRLQEGKTDETYHNFFSKIFGLQSKSSNYSGYGGAGGLEPDLTNIYLSREPFVSIHLASFNEKRVINRLLTAATSLDYKNYEVIVADDSTDETIDLLSTWSKHPRVKISHRETRDGFKGGALREALKKTDPRAEFIMVLDSDFIPYPDAITQFLKYFQATCGTLDFKKAQTTDYSQTTAVDGRQNAVDSRVAAIQGYQWHVLNKSENWVTRGVRSEYAGSYVIERSGEEIYGGLKQISGSVYMIRRDVLEEIGWGTSITEDFELTLKLYERGYKVVYTPYIQAPAEAVSTIKRLIRQRMRWAEGHSFNVKRMFKRLLFGHWEAQLTVEDRRLKIGLEDRGSMVDGLPSNFNHPSSKQWIPSPLSLSEKFEFAYLTPYYLQAAFFIAGTLSWFIAEVIFQVRLPFWSEVWGWSLVLTNLFALPLMNMVGMFLEEAEEKDYIGLLSFVALSYIVAPFQAYAAVKGFIEQEEGPWFRTPKTGRITDTFVPGRFYKFVFGVFGRGAEASVQSSKFKVQSFANQRPFLPNFNPAMLKPKRVRRIGRGAVVLTLIFTLGLNLLSFNQNLFNLGHDERLKGEATISGKTDFLESQMPQFRLKLPKESQKVSWYEKLLPKKAIASEPQVTATVLNQSKQPVKISTKIVKEGEGYTVMLPDAINLRPGKYTLNAFWRDQKGFQHTSSQDFTWGVLAVNTNKSIYAPNETVKLGFGTLDDKGKTLCDSNLTLEIVSPDGKKASLSSEKEQIKRSGKCNVTSVTNTADYLASYQTRMKGLYKLHLTATTQNGKRSIDDRFEVKDIKDIPFDLERSSYPTRIYPPADYPVTLTVIANRDFKGEVVETVPASFEVEETTDYRLQTSAVDGSQKAVDKKLIWNVNWKKGETHELSYTIKFPRKSPEFYLVGPLRFKTEDLGLKTKAVDGSQKAVDIFAEQRQWQIASDVVVTQFMETPDITEGKEFWDSVTGLVNYDDVNKKSGLASWQTLSQSGQAGYLRKNGILADAGRRITAYFLFGGLPTAGTTRILTIVPGGVGADILSLRLTTGGVLQFWNNTAQIGTDGSTIAAGNWYRFAVSYTITSTSVNEIRLFKDGNSTADISISNATLSNTVGTDLLMGWGNNPGASLAENVEHVYVDNGTTLDDPGDIRVTAKMPNVDSTRGWDTIIGSGTGDCANNTTEYGCINDRPIATATGWQQAATADVAENFNLESVSQGDVDITGKTLVARTAWVWAKRVSGSGACGSTADIWDNNSASAITLTTSPALYTLTTDSTTYPSNPAIGMRSCTAAQDTYFYEAGVAIAYLDVAIPEAALLLAPLAFFAPKLIKSIQQGTVMKDISEALRKIFMQIREVVVKLFARKKKKTMRNYKKKKKGG